MNSTKTENRQGNVALEVNNTQSWKITELQFAIN